MQFILPYHNGPTSKCSMKCNRFDCCVQMEKTILFSLVVVVILANYCEYSIIKRQQPHHPTLLPQDRKIFNSFSTGAHIPLDKMQFSTLTFVIVLALSFTPRTRLQLIEIQICTPKLSQFPPQHLHRGAEWSLKPLLTHV